MVDALRKEFIGGETQLEHRGNRVTVEDVKVDGSGPEHFVHILFREESRPECLFGFQEVAVEPEWDLVPSSETIVIDPSQGYWGPELFASNLIATYFMEQVEALGHGLPPECDPEGITWVTGYRDWSH